MFVYKLFLSKNQLLCPPRENTHKKTDDFGKRKALAKQVRLCNMT